MNRVNTGNIGASDMLTIWTIGNMTFVADAVLPELVGRPLLVTPVATEIEPTGTLRGLNETSGSGTRRDRDRTA